MTNLFADKQYLSNIGIITWVKSLKDVYQKFLFSSQSFGTPEDDMVMPCFYLRGGSFFAVFKLEDGAVSAELVGQQKLIDEIKSCKCKK